MPKSTSPARKAGTTPTPPEQQRQRLLDNERAANRDSPRNFKDDALSDKNLRVEPDGTGPTPTDTFDAPRDQAAEQAADQKDPKGRQPSPGGRPD